MRKAYSLPEALRPDLAEPLGHVFEGDAAEGEEFIRLVREAPMAVTVGDRVTETVERLGRTPEVQVVDGVERRTRRELPDVPYARLLKVKNPAGGITSEAIEGVRSAFLGKKPVRVLVDGEEDLLAMLAIAMAPVSATVFYGQPGVGVVAVRADALAKARTRAFLAKMGIRGLH